MFIDEVGLTCRAGNGGNGIVSWRRVKYIPKWGPYGGDGGDGGDVVLVATTHENTLTKFRHIKVVKAADGERGGTKEMHGKNADDVRIEVPVGTVVTDTEDGSVIVDLVEPGQTFVLCHGGRGGFGNAHFASSTRQAPDFAEIGDHGEEITVHMELKLVADVGLVGLPNAGKSTLIQSLTNVRPKIADYEFTTLIPNLGVMDHKGRSLVIEDVPGLIEGASDGKWLGTKFLKHIDRTHLLIHLLDASGWVEKMITDYQMIRRELEKWSDEMGQKPELIVFSKIDIIDPEMLEEMREIFEQETKKQVDLMISAGAYMNTDRLKDLLLERIPEKPKHIIELREDEDGNLIAPPVEKKMLPHDFAREQRRLKQCQVARREDGHFEVTGIRIEEIARMTDMRQIEGVNRVYDVLSRLGVMTKIRAMLLQDMEHESRGYFVGEADFETPNVYIAGKRFPIENILFMKER